MEPIITKTKGATYIDNDILALNPDRGEFRKAVIELTEENTKLKTENAALTENIRELTAIVNNTKFNVLEIIEDSEITITTVFTDITDLNNPVVVTDDIQNLAEGVSRQHTIQAVFTLPEGYIIKQINIEKSTGNIVIDGEDIVDNTIEFILDANIKLTVETELDLIPALASVTFTGNQTELMPDFDPDNMNYILKVVTGETITLSCTTNDSSVIASIQTDIEQATVSENSITFEATNVDTKIINISVFKGRAITTTYTFSIMEGSAAPEAPELVNE